MSDDLPHLALTDRYRVIERLGQGGMGVVYAVEDQKLGRRVALKTLRDPNSDHLFRLKHEFRALADLRHNNLARLYDLVVKGNTAFFTMELLPGTDLLTHCRNDHAVSGFDEARTRSAFAQLTEGLAALHAAGKVHRDIKPSNVRVTPEGRVVVLDFGLVAELDEAEQHTLSAQMGTVAYMAPEQALPDAPVTPAADAYSLGVVLYEVLTGRPPFSGSALKIMRDKQSQPAPRPQKHATRLPGDLQELCEALLQCESDQRPTFAAIGKVFAPRPLGSQSKAASPNRPPFFGRKSELVRMQELLAAAGEGLGKILLVEGESGMGKTALVREFVEQARKERQDLVFLEGRCLQRETVPYKAVDGLVDQLSSYWKRLVDEDAVYLLPREPELLPRVFPVLGRVPHIARAPNKRQIVDPQEVRSRAFLALRETLSRLAAQKKLVLFLDDLQWVDSETLILLCDLLRPPDTPALLLLLAARPLDAPSDDLAALLQPDAETIRLGPLDARDAESLARSLVGGGEQKLAQKIAREAGGVPFFVSALAKHAASLSPGRSSIGLEAFVRERLDRLEASERDVLEAVVIAGEPVPAAWLADAAGLTTATVTDQADALIAQHWLRVSAGDSSDRLEAYHDRIRETVLAALDDGKRQKWHEQWARALESRGAQVTAELLARHHAGAKHGERAARYAKTAAERAEQELAFDRAAELYRWSIDLGHWPRSDERALQTHLGDALANAGRGAAAADAYLAAAEGAPEEEQIELERRAAEELLRAGHFDRGASVMTQVLKSAGLSYPPSAARAVSGLLIRRAWLRLRGYGYRRIADGAFSGKALTLRACASAAIGLGFSDPVRAFYFQTRHLHLALRLGDQTELVFAFASQAGFLSLGARGDRRADGLLTKAAELTEELQSLEGQGFVTVMSGLICLMRGQWQAAVDLGSSAEQLLTTECTRVDWELNTSRAATLWSLAYLGRLADMRQRIPLLLRDASARGNIFGATVACTGMSGIVWLADDRVALGREQVAESMRPWTDRGFLLQHYWELLGTLQADLYDGEAESALETVVGAWPALQRARLMKIARLTDVTIRDACARVNIAVAQGRPKSEQAGFLRAALRDGKRVRRHGLAWSTPIAELLFAGVAHVRGEHDIAAAHLKHAVEGFDQTDMALHAAAARWRLGALLGGDEGTDLVAQAQTWMQDQQIKRPDRFTAMLAPGFDD